MRGVVAPNLARIDVDLDQFRRRNGDGVAVEPGAGGAIVKAAAEREYYVRVARGLVRGIGAVAPDRPQRQFMRLVDHALAVGARDDGDARELDEVEDRLARFADQAALADEDHRTLGIDQQLQRVLQRLQLAWIALIDWRIGIRDRDRRFLLEHVERHVDVDRAGPAVAQQPERLFHRERQHLHSGRLEAALDIGPDHRGIVALEVAARLLERVAVELRRGYVAGDGKKGRGIHHRVGERDRKIDRARAAGGDGRDRFVAHLVVSVGHVTRRLFVVR